MSQSSKTSFDMQIRPTDLENYSKPPTTRTLQRHFGLSRKEAVRFHKQHDASYNQRWQAGGEQNYKLWHSFTFNLCQRIKSKRMNSSRQRIEQIVNKAARELEEQPSAGYPTDISTAAALRLESEGVVL